MQGHDEKRGDQSGKREHRSLVSRVWKLVSTEGNQADKNREERSEARKKNLIPRPEPVFLRPRDPDHRCVAREGLCQYEIRKPPQVRPISVADEIRRSADRALAGVQQIDRVNRSAADAKRDERYESTQGNLAPTQIPRVSKAFETKQREGRNSYQDREPMRLGPRAGRKCEDGEEKRHFAAVREPSREPQQARDREKARHQVVLVGAAVQ